MFSTTCFLCLALLSLFVEAREDGHGPGGTPARVSMARQRFEAIEANRLASMKRFSPPANMQSPQYMSQGLSGLSPSPQGIHLMQGMESQNMPSINTIQSMHMLLISAYSRFLALYQLTMQSMTSPSTGGPKMSQSSADQIQAESLRLVQNEVLEGQKRQAEEQKNQLV